MKLRGLALAAALALGTACGHAKTVGPAAPPAAEQVQAANAPSITAKRERTSETISIASAPGLLLRPGAAESIQQRLARDGELPGAIGHDLDARTRDALARFQRGHDLPATGIPDDATVRALGLKPADIFRSGNADK